mgnify:CR=1 FL=1
MKIYKLLACIGILLLLSNPLRAHNIWIEVKSSGELNQSQKIVVHYGEYSYNYYETTDDGFKEVENFKLWLIRPDGSKKELALEKKPKSYVAEFVPQNPGLYSIILKSDKTEVVDWRDYNLGILKPNFYASATTIISGDKAQKIVHDEKALEKVNPLVIKPVFEAENSLLDDENNITLRVSYNGEPLTEHELVVGISDQWTKTVHTDEKGRVNFNLPWNMQYVVETVYTQKKSGSYKGKNYEKVRHTATYTLKL